MNALKWFFESRESKQRRLDAFLKLAETLKRPPLVKCDGCWTNVSKPNVFPVVVYGKTYNLCRHCNDARKAPVILVKGESNEGHK